MTDGPLGEFDLHAADARVGAETLWERMRASPALPHCARYGGFHLVTRFADLKTVLLNPALFSSAEGITLPAAAVRSAHIPAELDPPLQGEFRAILLRYFTPQSVRAMEAPVRALAHELLASFSGRSRVDFVEVFARPFPVHASVQLLGLPAEDAPMLDGLVVELHAEVATGIKRGAAAKLADYVERTLLTRKAQPQGPDDNVVAGILRGSVCGRPLTLAEQVSMVRLLLIGGFDSTAIALATAVWWLALHPHDAQRLRESPSLIDKASEEVVRFASPASYLRRTVTAPTELAGTRLQAGDQVLASFAAANRDPAEFARPDEIVLDRSPNPHLGFGAGVHRCIGSFFAKLEMRVMLEEMLKRYASIRIDESKPIRMSSGHNQGIIALPLILGEPDRP
jgi:cytochrome P450